MTPKDWERLKNLFGEALSLAPEERGAFVEKVCIEDENLGRRLAELIGDGTIEPLDKPLVDFHEFVPSDDVPNTQSSANETEPLSGLRISQILGGRFRILRRVGQGGMGEVYEAYDLQLKDRVALKTIRPQIAANPNAAARFKREILLGKRVAHPNVCRIHDLGSATTEDGAEILFFTMEFLSGETLASRIKRGPMSPGEALPLIESMADGLTAAHRNGVIHRDFKSGNVMLVDSRDGRRAVITDFGLARLAPEAEEHVSAITKPGAVAGTVAYMAPEQVRGEEATPLSDIYSFGVVMFEMVTGRLPFTGDSDLNVALRHLNERPPSPREFAPHLDDVWEATIVRCLEKTPDKRVGSAAAIKDSLISGSIPRQGPRFRHWKLALASLTATAILGAGALVYRDWRPPLSSSQQRVAVLEFENVGGDPANRVFCEGLMEALSSQLTELEEFQGSLSVVPASDVRRDKITSVREAQRDFGVTLVVTGSVQRSPMGVRLTINVVDARQLKQLRSHAMFIPQADAVSMQQGVIAQITELLDIQLRPEAQRRLATGSTQVPGAYDFYLQGAGYLLNGTGAVDQAITEFRHALERDPDYALAHAGLGQAYWSKYLETKDKVWIDQAWRECRRSTELGPKLAEPHITLALLSSGTGHYDQAIQEARLAIQIDPFNDRGYSELARALDATGRLSEAEATIEKAIALRPGYWYNYVRLGIFYGKHGKYKEAESPFKRVIDLVPDNPAGYTNLAAIYHLEGRESDAERMLKESIRARPTTKAYTDLATVYFFERRYADALPIMEKVIADGSKDYMQWGNLGDAYRWTAGNEEKAARTYQKAIELAQVAVAVNPRDATALSQMALYRAKLGQTAGAVPIAKKAVANAPDDKGILFNAAVVFELAGERAQALNYIRRAIAGGYSPHEIAIEPELTRLRQDPGYQAAISVTSGH